MVDSRREGAPSMDTEAFLDDLLPDDWGHDADIFGIEFSLIAPDGCLIEQDGECSHGHVSPLKLMGMI